MTHLELWVEKTEYFTTMQDAVEIFQGTRMHKNSQEAFWVLGFGPLLNVATLFEVNRGMYAYVDLHMPSLIGGVLAAGCERFWLAHNHPSLDLRPSPLDLKLTADVMNAANLMRLHFEDHLILVPNGEYLSFEKEGLMLTDPKSPYLRAQGDNSKFTDERYGQ